MLVNKLLEQSTKTLDDRVLVLGVRLLGPYTKAIYQEPWYLRILAMSWLTSQLGLQYYSVLIHEMSGRANDQFKHPLSIPEQDSKDAETDFQRLVGYFRKPPCSRVSWFGRTC